MELGSWFLIFECSTVIKLFNLKLCYYGLRTQRNDIVLTTQIKFIVTFGYLSTLSTTLDKGCLNQHEMVIPTF